MQDNKVFGTVEPLNNVAATHPATVEQATANGFATLADRMAEYYTDATNTPPIVATGFYSIDADLKFNGFTMLGGASGAGKTSLCLNIAYNRALQGFKTIFYSLEMPVPSLIKRLICIALNVDYLHALDMWQRFEQENAAALKNIYFVSGKDMTAGNVSPRFDTAENSDLVKTIQAIKMEQATANGNAAPDVLLIVDSLHLLPADAADVRAATNENVIKLRNLTDTYNINSIVIGQSKRGEKSFEYVADIWDKKTKNHDTAQLRAQFRESALIEYAADALFYLLNDNRPPENVGEEIKWLCMVKNRIADAGRNAAEKIKGLAFKGARYLFMEKYTNNDLTERAKTLDDAERAATESEPTAERAATERAANKRKSIKSTIQ